MQVKCKFCLEKKDRDGMECVQKGKVKSYYCPECLKLLNSRDRALELFYSYTQSLVPTSQVYLAFSKLREKGLTHHDVLYIMEYVIKTNSKLNYPMGLIYYADKAIRQKKSEEQIKLQKEKVLNTIHKTPTIIENKIKFEKSVNDESDISDFL